MVLRNSSFSMDWEYHESAAAHMSADVPGRAKDVANVVLYDLEPRKKRTEGKEGED